MKLVDKQMSDSTVLTNGLESWTEGVNECRCGATAFAGTFAIAGFLYLTKTRQIFGSLRR